MVIKIIFVIYYEVRVRVRVRVRVKKKLLSGGHIL